MVVERVVAAPACSDDNAGLGDHHAAVGAGKGVGVIMAVSQSVAGVPERRAAWLRDGRHFGALVAQRIIGHPGEAGRVRQAKGKFTEKMLTAIVQKGDVACKVELTHLREPPQTSEVSSNNSDCIDDIYICLR